MQNAQLALIPSPLIHLLSSFVGALYGPPRHFPTYLSKTKSFAKPTLAKEAESTYEYDSELGMLYDQIILNDSPSIAATVELKKAITISTVPSFVKSIKTGGFITPANRCKLGSLANQNKSNVTGRAGPKMEKKGENGEGAKDRSIECVLPTIKLYLTSHRSSQEHAIYGTS